MKQPATANSMLLFWLAAGCVAVAFASDENSSVKRLLRDLNSPGLHLVTQSHQAMEQHQWFRFLIAKNSSTIDAVPGIDTGNEQSSLKISRLQREVLALKELLEQQKNREKVSLPTSGLFSPKLIAARILLPDQQQRWKSGTLLDAGASKKIREHDWILSEERPLIDLGEDFGLKPDEILLSGRVVVGQIDAVGRWTSSYRSITDPEFRCPATVMKAGNTAGNTVQKIDAVGSFHGTENKTGELRYIENTYPVRVGDLVVLADEQKRFEGSLVLGTITEARVMPNSPFWKIRVRPAKILETSRNLQIITEELNPLRLLVK